MLTLIVLDIVCYLDLVLISVRVVVLLVLEVRYCVGRVLILVLEIGGVEADVIRIFFNVSPLILVVGTLNLLILIDLHSRTSVLEVRLVLVLV